MADSPRRLTDTDDCADEIIRRVGPRLVVGLPLGLGKPIPLIDALYRRAVDDPSLRLEILTALTLRPPSASSELERRLVEPLAARVFSGYRPPIYSDALVDGSLPPNVIVREFYLEPGRWLRHPRMQQSYASSNYTHVVRDAVDRGINVFAQLVAPDPRARRSAGNDAALEDERLSLAGNSDLTLDLLPHLEQRRQGGEPVAVVASTHPDLPFMLGDAALPATSFDLVLDDPSRQVALFGPPNQPVSDVEYAIALHASLGVRDGGTLQLGIGSLGDAICRLLILRHRQNDDYLRLLADAELPGPWADLTARIGGTDSFDEGLYAATELLADGFLELDRGGVLHRTVEDPVSGEPVIAHAGFFLGPRAFYEALRTMPEDRRRRYAMTRISFVNELYGDACCDEATKRAQRRHARFLNTCFKATLLGAVASDALEDQRVVSGVGGQYNFVAMAHALEDGRSALMLRATRGAGRSLESNVVWSYGHTTIPRHLRDLVITEYGIADLRGRSDAECAAAMLEITDARFQDALLRQAQRLGKLPKDHRISERARGNRPARVRQLVAAHRELLPELPFGSDLSAEEITLGRALKAFKGRLGSPRRLLDASSLRAAASPPSAARPYLERMRLDAPRSLEERLLRAVVVYALRSIQAI